MVVHFLCRSFSGHNMAFPMHKSHSASTIHSHAINISWPRARGAQLMTSLTVGGATGTVSELVITDAILCLE